MKIRKMVGQFLDGSSLEAYALEGDDSLTNRIDEADSAVEKTISKEEVKKTREHRNISFKDAKFCGIIDTTTSLKRMQTEGVAAASRIPKDNIRLIEEASRRDKKQKSTEKQTTIRKKNDGRDFSGGGQFRIPDSSIHLPPHQVREQDRDAHPVDIGEKREGIIDGTDNQTIVGNRGEGRATGDARQADQT